MKIKNGMLVPTLILAFFVVLSFVHGQVKSESPVKIPVEDFFKDPQMVGCKLSPNGEYLSLLKPWQNRLNIFIRKIGEEKELRISNNLQQSVREYEWVSDERLIYMFDAGGDENLKLYSVNRDGTGVRVLSALESNNATIINVLRDNSQEILVGIGKKAYQNQDVYRINYLTGQKHMVAENPDDVEYWLADNQGAVLVAQSTEKDDCRKIYFRKTEKEKFKVVYQTAPGEKTQPVLFTENNQNIYVASNKLADTVGLYTFDISNGQFLEKIFSHSQVDTFGANYSYERKIITDVIYITEKPQLHFLDPQRKLVYEKIAKHFSDLFIQIISWNLKETLFLLQTLSDKNSGSYYFYNSDTDQINKIGDMAPWLPEASMAEMKPIQFSSRDGLVINGYLTLPLGVEPKNLPAVVLPHGGPWSRDVWGFNPEVQFLASRGYAVMQINFRGSTGYGRKFLEMGYKQWGQKMQDDISDGVKWLVQQGIADPRRIGIYGVSYGGYAALAGVTFSPDLYACAVDCVGISDLIAFAKMSTFLYPRVGHPKKDREMLLAFSPFYHADKIKVPLFIAQGANDPRVLQSQSDKMVEALKKRQVPVIYLVKENEGHGFNNIENRIEFYKTMEEFLDKYLKNKK